MNEPNLSTVTPPDIEQELRTDFHRVMRALPAKRREFVNQMLLTGVAAQAGRKVYGNAESGHTAMNDPKVREAIELGQQYRWLGVHADAQRVMFELLEMLDADPADMIADDGTSLKPLDEWPRGLRKRLKSFTVKATANGVMVSQPRFTEHKGLVELFGKHVDVAAFKDAAGIDEAAAFAAMLREAESKADALEHEPDPAPALPPAGPEPSDPEPI